MTPTEAKNEYNRLKKLQDELTFIRKDEAYEFYLILQGKISVLLDVYNGNKIVYTQNITKFILQNKKK